MTMTANPSTVVDSGGYSVRRTISIAAPLDRVWAAITQAEHIARWFPQRAELEPVAVGAGGVLHFDGYDDLPIVVEELAEPRMIAYRWSNSVGESADPTRVDPEHSTVFRFTLQPVDGGTQLTVVETGFDTLADPGASMEDHRSGWDSELDELVAYLEGGS